MFNICQASVSRLAKKLDEDGHLHPAKGKWLKPKLNDADLEVVKEIVEVKNDLTLMEIAKRIEGRLGKIISVPTVHRALKKIRSSLQEKDSASRGARHARSKKKR